jgi:hypothetical protein
VRGRAVHVTRDEGRRAGRDVPAREVERVLRRLEECDRAPEMVERNERPRLLVRDAAERPVEADPRVRVGDVGAALERFLQHIVGALEVAHVGERVAEVGREADVRGVVIRPRLRRLREATLEDLDRLRRHPGVRVGAAERREHVGPRAGVDEIGLDGLLEVLDRLLVLAPPRRCEPQRDVRAARRDRVAEAVGLAQDLGEVLERQLLVVEAQPEFRLRQLELPELRGGDLRAGLEVLGRHAELPRQHAQRFDGGTARAGLDPGDVRVRHTG